MSDGDTQETVSGTDRAGGDDELRTIGFRLREIQRLLAVRVEQENRRMEANGVDPVEESRFVRADSRQAE